MEHILPSIDELIQQRLADIHIQIQELKLEQNKSGKNKNLSNICHQKLEQLHKQKELVFEHIIHLLYALGDTYNYL